MVTNPQSESIEETLSFDLAAFGGSTIATKAAYHGDLKVGVRGNEVLLAVPGRNFQIITVETAR